MHLKRIFLGVLITLAALPSPSFARAGRSRLSHHLNHHPAVPVASPLIGWSSWYGPEMRVKSSSTRHGNVYRRMANGKFFDPTRLTAASRTLPLGTMVRVWNLHTGRSVVVEITDRGPFTRGRILDLAEAAAEKIGCQGLCPVLLQNPDAVIPLPSTASHRWLAAQNEGEVR